MPTYIVLLKGKNVGGHKKVPMLELRKVLEASCFQNVRTYIQSGNVVLESSATAKKIEDTVHKNIHVHFGFEVAVIVKTREELQTIFVNSPFPKDKKENSYFIVFSKIPDANLLTEVASISYENEEIVIKKDCLYFHSSAGYGKSKFNMATFERKLKVIGTARNYNTMLKLLSLSEEK
jgi:uncharacterized protein (DUF1697 family)